MPSRKSTKPNRRPELVDRSPRGNISRVIIRSKQEGQPGSIRINVPGEHRQSGEQEGVLLGLPATHQNLAAVQGVLDKLNARIHILRDLDIKALTKNELKNYILEQLGQPKQEKAKPVLGKSLDLLFLEFVEHRRSILKRSKATLATYNTVYKIIKKLKTKDLACRDEILKELGELPNPTYYRALQKISTCCNWAVEEDKIQKNPFLVILKSLAEPKPTDEYPDPFSRQAMERIIEAYRKHPNYSCYADLVEFYFLTGVRTGEAVALL